MKNKISSKGYFLLIIPFIFSYFANEGFGFIYKAAVTLSCISILLLLNRNNLKSDKSDWFVLAAFIFSISGDWFLSSKGDSFLLFSAGIGMYFLAHAGYLAFALYNGKFHKKFTSVLLIAYLLFFYFQLYPVIDEKLLLISTLLYLLISCFSLGAAAGIQLEPVVKWTFFAGMALILFSDTIIAFHEFTHFQKLNFLILPTYYASHIIITFSLLRKSTSKKSIKG